MMTNHIFVATGTSASGDQVDFVGTEQDVTTWLIDNEADPDTAYWRELTPGELAALDGHYDGYPVPTGGDATA
jgi:hypothetical protein